MLSPAEIVSVLAASGTFITLIGKVWRDAGVAKKATKALALKKEEEEAEDSRNRALDVFNRERFLLDAQKQDIIDRTKLITDLNCRIQVLEEEVRSVYKKLRDEQAAHDYDCRELENQIRFLKDDNNELRDARE